jgi:hypothetical protein
MERNVLSLTVDLTKFVLTKHVIRLLYFSALFFYVLINKVNYNSITVKDDNYILAAT